MRISIAIPMLALAVLASPAPAAPAVHDMLFPRKEVTPITQHAAGQPFWALLAQCAGVYGAGANFESARGRADAADDDTRIGTRMANEALRRLQDDRGLTRDDALAYVGVEVNSGRAQGQEMLSGGGGGFEAWNLKRNACLDVEEVYHHYRNRS
jgi:hypothetical protein